ncbi:hypothetical protein HK101_000722, partial [Irineochytrium annulatum]
MYYYRAPSLHPSYDAANKMILVGPPNLQDANLSNAQVKQLYTRVIAEAVANTREDPDRFFYALAGKAFHMKAPIPIGGSVNPGFLMFNGSRASDILDWLLSTAIQPCFRQHSAGKRRRRGFNPPDSLLKFVVIIVNDVLRLVHDGHTEILEDFVGRGRIRVGHMGLTDLGMESCERNVLGGTHAGGMLSGMTGMAGMTGASRLELQQQQQPQQQMMADALTIDARFGNADAWPYKYSLDSLYAKNAEHLYGKNPESLYAKNLETLYAKTAESLHATKAESPYGKKLETQSQPPIQRGGAQRGSYLSPYADNLHTALPSWAVPELYDASPRRDEFQDEFKPIGRQSWARGGGFDVMSLMEGMGSMRLGAPSVGSAGSLSHAAARAHGPRQLSPVFSAAGDSIWSVGNEDGRG